MEWFLAKTMTSFPGITRCLGPESMSLATNATTTDGHMLLRTVPHWLRVFGARLNELLIIVDREPLMGRIGEMQCKQSLPDQFDDAINELCRADSRVRFIELLSLDPDPIQRRWFGNARPVRCQAGTPLLAFAAAIDQASSNIILRCDSDMLFCERGWLREANLSFRHGVDVYEPPRLHLALQTVVSSRAFMVNKSSFYDKLPLRSLRLDVFRMVHRMIKKRSPWVALEQMMTRSVRTGQLSHKIGQNTGLGYSLHGVMRSYAERPWFLDVIHAVETGEVPPLQYRSWDLCPEEWGIHLS